MNEVTAAVVLLVVADDDEVEVKEKDGFEIDDGEADDVVESSI